MISIKTTQKLAFAGMLFAISCGESTEINGDVGELTRIKDSLRKEKNEISIRINEIEDKLKLLDSNGQHNVPLVVVEEIVQQDFRHFFKVHGVVETDQNAEINPEVSAKIMAIHVKEGESVSKGTTLIKLDSKIVENNIAEVKTQISLAETVYKKQKNLWDQNIGSEIQYLEAKNNLESLQRRLETLQSQLAMYSVKAPFAGVVDEIFAKVGEMASPMMPSIRLVNLGEVYIKSDVSERYLGKIEVGDTALIEFPSINAEMKSRVSRIGNYINPNNRSFKIRFEIANPEGKLKPNLLAEVNIMDYEAGNAVVVPTKVIQETPMGEEFVYTLKRNGAPRAEKRMVKTGMTYKGSVEILEGLTSGEELIVEGARSIKDGEIVEVN